MGAARRGRKGRAPGGLQTLYRKAVTDLEESPYETGSIAGLSVGGLKEPPNLKDVAPM